MKRRRRSTSGLFVKGGLGFGYEEREVQVRGVTVSGRRDGAAATLQLGYDVQPGGSNLFLTPAFDVMLQGVDGLESVDAVYSIGLEIGFR